MGVEKGSASFLKKRSKKLLFILGWWFWDGLSRAGLKLRRGCRHTPT
jgi:hypothetical protein